MKSLNAFVRAVKKTVRDLHEPIPHVAVKMVLLKFFYDRDCYFPVASAISEIFDDFTFNRMLSVWAGWPVNVLDEESFSVDILDRNKIIAFVKNDAYDIASENETLLGEIYQATLPTSQKKEEGVTYTPEEIREYMTGVVRDEISCEHTLVDPACGCGWFLLSFYQSLMNRYYQEGSDLSIAQIHRQILSYNIYGMDKSPMAVAIARISLSLLYHEYVDVTHITARDSLCDTPKEMLASFDWVVTNPPYVGHKKLGPDTRGSIVRDYAEVFVDKSDLSYCFFKLGHSLLKDSGRLLVITSRYFMQSQFASRLRAYILSHFSIVRVIDFFGYRPFVGAGVDPAIFDARKGYVPGNVFVALKPASKEYNVLTNPSEAESLTVNQDELNEVAFSFNNANQKILREAVEAKSSATLGDVMLSFQGIITGCDKAFIVNKSNRYNEAPISECGVKWLKGKALKEGLAHDGKYLLYVNDETDHQTVRATISRLRNYRSLLENRREVKNGVRKWYALQWGRNRALFEQPKIIYPYKHDKSCFVYDENNYFFSADIYAMIPKEGFGVDMKKLAMLLSSAIYDSYFKSFAKKLGGALYEYYPNTIMRMRIPDAETINSFDTEADIFDYFLGTQATGMHSLPEAASAT